jgi:group I intron endonuclease
LEILEYCDRDKCIEREQYYIDLLRPEYNILQTAGSRLGSQQSEETKAKIAVGWTKERRAQLSE